MFPPGSRALPCAPRSRPRTTHGQRLAWALGAALLAACTQGGGSSGGGNNPGGTLVDAIAFGMNASFNGWSNRGIPLADAMARASEFAVIRGGVLTFDVAPTIPLGESPRRLGEGWPDLTALAPGEGVGARLFNDMGGTMPDGRVTPYVVTWLGTGSCSLEGPPVVGEANRTANRVEVFIDPTVKNGDAQLSWILDDSDPLDPVRSVHVWLPGTEAATPILWAPYVEKVRRMNRGEGPRTWRALDWLRINNYGSTDANGAFVFDLAGRIRPSSPSQGTRRGVCPEFLVAFCNAVGANLHFQVPHRTDVLSEADYLTFLTDALRVIRDGSPAVPGVNGNQPFRGLDPGLKVRVELSNEIWSPGSPANNWMRDLAMQNGMDLLPTIAGEIQTVFDTADLLFAGADAGRLEKYVGGWIADASYCSGLLAGLRPGTHVDAIGPAAYFGPQQVDVDAWLVGADVTTGDCPNCPTAQEVLLSARGTVELVRAELKAHRLVADGWLNPDGSSPRLVLYEGGQSIVAGNQPWAPAAEAAQRHADLYYAYVEGLVPMLVEERVDEILWYSFMSSQDAGGAGLAPFGAWDNMSQEIVLPVPDVYVDEGAPKAAAIYRGPPQVPPGP